MTTSAISIGKGNGMKWYMMSVIAQRTHLTYPLRPVKKKQKLFRRAARGSKVMKISMIAGSKPFTFLFRHRKGPP